MDLIQEDYKMDNSLSCGIFATCQKSHLFWQNIFHMHLTKEKLW